MKNLLKSILSLAVFAAVLGAIWMYISKLISADEFEDEMDEDFDNFDEFEDDEVELRQKKRGYFTLKTKADEAKVEEAEA
jgi:hypothetical protein